MADVITQTLAARELMANPAFMRAVDQLKEHYLDALLGTAANEQDKREELYRRVSVLGGVMTELADIAQNPIETAH